MVKIIGDEKKISEKLKTIIQNGRLDNSAGWATKEDVSLAIKDTFENEKNTMEEVFKGF